MYTTFPLCSYRSAYSPEFSLKILYAMIDWICLGIPKQCMVGYFSTNSIFFLFSQSTTCHMAEIQPSEDFLTFSEVSQEAGYYDDWLFSSTRRYKHVSMYDTEKSISAADWYGYEKQRKILWYRSMKHGVEFEFLLLFCSSHNYARSSCFPRAEVLCHNLPPSLIALYCL